MRRLLLLPALVLALVALFDPSPRLPGQEKPAAEWSKLAPVVDPGGPTTATRKVAFTPDGKFILTGSEDSLIRVWDAATGQMVRSLHPPGSDGGLAFALSPDGKLVAVGASHGKGQEKAHAVYLLSFADGAVVKVLFGHTKAIRSVAFSPDGKQVASRAEDSTVRVWGVASGKEEMKFTTNVEGPLANWHGTDQLAFAPGGKRLACIDGHDGGDLLVFNLETQKTRRVKPEDGKALLGVAWVGRPGEDPVLAVRGLGAVRLYGPDLKALPEQPGHDFYARGLAVGKDVVLVAWHGNPDHRVTVFDRATNKARFVFKPEESARREDANRKEGKKRWPDGLRCREVWDVALSPDGTLAASCGGGDGVHETLVWKVTDGAIVHRLASPSWLFPQQAVTWTAGGRAVCWGAPWEKEHQTFNLATLTFEAGTKKKDRHGEVLQEDGWTLEKMKDKTGRDIYNATQVVKAGQKDVEMPRLNHTVQSMTFAGPGRVALCDDYGSFLLADAKTGKFLHAFGGRRGYVWSIAPHPDRGRYLAALADDQVLRIYDTNKALPLLSMYARGEDWVIWTQAGYYAASPGGERFLSWAQDNGKEAAPTIHPAATFRAQLYRPDVIKLVLQEGSVPAALKAANQVREANKEPVPRGAGQVEQLLPPVVTVEITDAKNLPTVTVRLRATQGCAEQPIRSLRLLVDGRPLPGGVGRFTYEDGKLPAKADEVVTVQLPPGTHNLSVLARARDDAPGVSTPVTVVCPLPKEARPVVHHVGVGVSEYADKNLKLNVAADDATGLGKALAASAARGTLFRAANSAVLTNKAATKPAALAAIDKVRKEARANDLFVFSFAGHGVREEGEFFLLTHEADTTNARTLEKTAISGAALRAALADFPCQVLVLLDACHAGAFGAGPLRTYKPPTDEAARALADVETRVTVLCAAQGHEEALEDGEIGHGHFTHAILRALRRDRGTFFDEDTGELNVYHLQAFVYQSVTKATQYKQTPYLKMPLAQPAFVVTHVSR